MSLWPTPGTRAKPRGDSVCRHSTVSGFRSSRSDPLWPLQLNPPTPAEEFELLDDAVHRAREAFYEYRRCHSPRDYCDQFATFVAEDPCPVVERALVEAGWIESQPRFEELGLFYWKGAHFRVRFPEEKRSVLVSVDRTGNDSWRLAVRCYCEVYTDSGPPVPVRSNNRDGTVIPDPAAPALSYRVAMVIDSALTAAVSNEQWALHGEPTEATGSAEPIAPSSA